ncbi:hypothetical protein H072_6282 [Dactylellina haptotyla CBS 200.50]|uniref:Uncharacterized protein n=1 Tax=Dactylellina haptotyla (strain CBS 200.50) TaxID=1284197 RepID=S8AFJ8_DACHA|nr:hypothetical protein H072_6282 [Dactylellina haptotyla CBS 200.50]
MPCSAYSPWLPLPLGFRLGRDEVWYRELMYKHLQRTPQVLEERWREFHTPRVDPPGQAVIEKIRKYNGKKQHQAQEEWDEEVPDFESDSDYQEHDIPFYDSYNSEAVVYRSGNEQTQNATGNR